MAHFAKLDENNTVLEVLVVNNEVLNNLPFPDSEPIGIEFLIGLTGYSNWKQTSYNASFRKNYAGTGFTYDSVRNAFIPPNQFSSWVLNEDTCCYDPPVPYPNDDKLYTWDEATLSWKEVT